MKEPAAASNEYDIEQVRQKFVGFETAESRGRYPVEYDPIRRHCHMVDDNNPLFLDPEYAKETSHGAVLCPPSGWLALYFASLGPWPAVFEPLFPIVPTPGKRIVNMSQEVEWSTRIKVGDQLSVRRRIADVYQKAVSLDPEAVWIVAEAVISNQRGEEVCVVRNTMLTHRTREEQGVRSQELGRPNAEQGTRGTRELGPGRAGGRTKRRPAAWEEVEVGGELEGFSLDITARRLVLQVSGSQDWYPVHFDAAFARKGGHADVFMNTGFLQAALVRVITDWMGDEGFLKRLRFEMRRMQRPGDTMVCKGKVVSRYEQDGAGLVDLEVWAENEREGVTTPGTATVALPRSEQ